MDIHTVVRLELFRSRRTGDDSAMDESPGRGDTELMAERVKATRGSEKLWRGSLVTAEPEVYRFSHVEDKVRERFSSDKFSRSNSDDEFVPESFGKRFTGGERVSRGWTGAGRTTADVAPVLAQSGPALTSEFEDNPGAK